MAKPPLNIITNTNIIRGFMFGYYGNKVDQKNCSVRFMQFLMNYATAEQLLYDVSKL